MISSIAHDFLHFNHFISNVKWHVNWSNLGVPVKSLHEPVHKPISCMNEPDWVTFLALQAWQQKSQPTT